MAKTPIDPVMRRAAILFADSGKSLDQLGLEMGYREDLARKAAWQFLNKTNDPRLSMLRKFATAMDMSLTELMDGGKRK